MNFHYPPQAPECQKWAPLLPLLDDLSINTPDILAAREHRKTCAYCQAKCEQYAIIDRALRCHYGASSMPKKKPEEILQHISDRAMFSENRSHRYGLSRYRTFITTIPSIACVIIIIMLAITVFNGRSVNNGLGIGPIVDTPQYSFPGVQGYLSDIAMVSPYEGWALGQVTKANGDENGLNEIALYHYLNNNWTPTFVKTDVSFIKGGLTGDISMDSPTEGWAAVSNYNDALVLLHYTNGIWTQYSTELDISQVQAISPTAVWGLKTSFNGNTNSIIHFDGASWKSEYTSTGIIHGIMMISDTQGWAMVSNDDFSQYKIMQYSNGQWNFHSTLPPEFDVNAMSGYYSSFAMLSSSEGWAVGQKGTQNSKGATPQQQVLYHYKDGNWNETQSFIDNNRYVWFSKLVMHSANNGWIMGQEQNTYFGATVNNFRRSIFLLHYNGKSWQQVNIPNLGVPAEEINSLSFASDDTIWACGYVSTYPASDTLQENEVLARGSPLLMKYINGSWQIFKS
jgi:hypothetical protein